MQFGFRFRNCKITKLQNPQRGYMLITLMLALALIAIGLMAVLPDIKQQVQRDREEELRHRGTAYMRAIQHFFKKFGRYPTRVEELESTNNMRFLRKRYKDPMTRDAVTGKEKDFKFLHQTDINLNNGPVLGQIPGQSGFGGQPGANGASPFGGLGGQTGGLRAAAGADQTSASGDSANSGFANSGSGNSGSGNSGSGNSNASGSPGANSGSDSSSGFNGPTFGGGPIIGVASTSKAKTIRVFADKTHYNDWLFIYLAQFDRGGLLVGPVNPNQPPIPNLNGVAGQGPSLGVPIPQGLGQGFTPKGGQNQVMPQPQQNTGQTPPPEQ